MKLIENTSQPKFEFGDIFIRSSQNLFLIKSRLNTTNFILLIEPRSCMWILLTRSHWFLINNKNEDQPRRSGYSDSSLTKSYPNRKDVTVDVNIRKKMEAAGVKFAKPRKDIILVQLAVD